MAVNESSYAALLGELGMSTEWSRQDDYEKFKTYLDENHPGLREGDGGYEKLLRELLEIGADAPIPQGREEESYRRFRIAVMAYDDPGYPGYVRSFNFNDEPVRVLAEVRFTADPDTGWAQVTEDQGAAEEQPDEQGRRRDKATGLLWDDKSWYTPDRGITVTFDPTGKVFDNPTGLLFDAEYWYTPAGVIVYLDTNDDTSTWSYDDNGHWYDHGILSAGTAAAAITMPTGKLELDPKSGLRYDKDNWYLPDNDILVYLSPDSPGWCYDDNGNWYQQNGQEWKLWTSTETGGAAAADTAGAEGVGAVTAEVTQTSTAAAVPPELVQEARGVVTSFTENFIESLPPELAGDQGVREFVEERVAQEAARILAARGAA
jgi:uncharacterized protein YneR